MFKTVEATIEKNGEVHLKERIHLKGSCRAIVTIFDDTSSFDSIDETALMSEPALATDWNRPEEDDAWSHLQKAR